MSERITSEWTETLKEAYGDTEVIRNAVLAEEMYKAFCERTYDEVRYTPGNRIYQEVGVDIEFKKNKWKRFYTTDVKSNLKDDGSFLVDNAPLGWLRNPKKISDRIAHININSGYMVEYDRKQMIRLIDREIVSASEGTRIELNTKTHKELLSGVTRQFNIGVKKNDEGTRI